MYVGDRVRCKYKGRAINGEIIAVNMADVDSSCTETETDISICVETEPTWTIQFEDDFNKKRMRSMLKGAESIKAGKQIDYALVSNRWKSSVKDCRPRWAHLSTAALMANPETTPS